MSPISFIGLATFLIFTTETHSTASDWTSTCLKCKCKWVSGKKTADCSYSHHTAVPSLSSEVQHLDLNGNKIHSLSSDSFKSVGLVHLHKLYLKNCGIQELHKDAFKGLQILIELDLSENKIHILHPGTFQGNYRLRIIYMSRNPIQRLEDGLFTNLTFLQTVDMSQCLISHISSKTFVNVSNLHTFILNGNRLSHMKLSVVDKLYKLRSLELKNNPWRCDCHLKAFRDWVVDHKLYSQPTFCHEPQSLENKIWTDIESEAFACKPQILYPNVGTTVVADGDEVSLSCRVTGNPTPEVHWVYNARIITNNTRTKYGDLKYLVRSSGEINRWVNVTVTRVRPQDRGEFTCVAKSFGGVDERNITLIVKSSNGGYIGSAGIANSWPIVIGLTTGLTAVFLIVIILCCCCCRKRKNLLPGKKSPVNGVSPNGDITHHIGAAEQEKSLLAVNPVQKPPRRYEVQISPTAGTEMSELNRKLLDDGSVIAHSILGDEDRSSESIETTPQRLRDKLESETYPPDLIAFQGRGHTASPAGSSTSTALDPASRHTLHLGHQSPLHSPIYNGFGMLPYSRSQSPFSPAAPIILPCQGYVTIPRRPRIPSWSSAPTPSLLEDPLSPIKAEPVYDNLGPRTTVDGSSILSLNKAGTDTNPRRKTPSIPSSFSPYEEKEGGILRPLPSPLSPDDKRYWRNRSGDGILKRVGSADMPIETISKAKVAPKPPPKPKSNVPLYEDEGEDGTEV
ncbi:uncharacterized protein LOC106673046 [Cimex lectularius]|uniref:Ig-like domain-containing protein n=1 Tax=Cimex lectularius TaxID=79782 RepID=A0A8I6S9N8_CIMLE|nr:uncharacterized protein LOC106673046 [Cimex lectularius]XP_014260450.1 uncharacterized protein LOC106673046 [Cimex lectularius]XP_014260452.1 uncharacterized protein LOC106673046 [Cimex lectularius]XP_014260453.1 uncharacterized protein LOC106673046 [Cimex lectularius]XP_014260454.1 uncharacterized protein LOC106673046 [Cimex lectularius]